MSVNYEYIYVGLSLASLFSSGVIFLALVCRRKGEEKFIRMVLNICGSNIIWCASSSFGFVASDDLFCKVQSSVTTCFLKISLLTTVGLLYQLQYYIRENDLYHRRPLISSTRIYVLIWVVSIVSTLIPFAKLQNLSMYGPYLDSTKTWCFLRGPQSDLIIICTFDSILLLGLMAILTILLIMFCSIDMRFVTASNFHIYQGIKLYTLVAFLCYLPLTGYLIACNICSLANLLPKTHELYHIEYFLWASLAIQAYGLLFSICFYLTTAQCGVPLLAFCCGRQPVGVDEQGLDDLIKQTNETNRWFDNDGTATHGRHGTLKSINSFNGRPSERPSSARPSDLVSESSQSRISVRNTPSSRIQSPIKRGQQHEPLPMIQSATADWLTEGIDQGTHDNYDPDTLYGFVGAYGNVSDARIAPPPVRPSVISIENRSNKMITRDYGYNNDILPPSPSRSEMSLESRHSNRSIRETPLEHLPPPPIRPPPLRQPSRDFSGNSAISSSPPSRPSVPKRYSDVSDGEYYDEEEEQDRRFSDLSESPEDRTTRDSTIRNRQYFQSMREAELQEQRIRESRDSLSLTPAERERRRQEQEEAIAHDQNRTSHYSRLGQTFRATPRPLAPRRSVTSSTTRSSLSEK